MRNSFLVRHLVRPFLIGVLFVYIGAAFLQLIMPRDTAAFVMSLLGIVICALVYLKTEITFRRDMKRIRRQYNYGGTGNIQIIQGQDYQPSSQVQVGGENNKQVIQR